MKYFTFSVVAILCFLNLFAQGHKTELIELKLDSIQKYTFNSESRQFEQSGLASYEYNFEDHSQKTTTTSLSLNDAQRNLKHIYSYDGSGNLLSDSLYRFANDAWYLSEVRRVDNNSTEGVFVDTIFYIQSTSVDSNIGYKVSIRTIENFRLINKDVFLFYKDSNEYKIWESTTRNYSEMFSFLRKQIITRYWDSGEPYIYGQTINLFNENGYLTEGTSMYYNELNNELEKFSYVRNEYDVSNRLIAVENLSEWDEEFNDWSFGNRTEYEYNENDQKIVTKDLFREFSDEAEYHWRYTYKQSYKFNEFGNRVEMTIAYYDSNIESWVSSLENFYTYVNDTVLSNIVTDYFNPTIPDSAQERSVRDYFYNDFGKTSKINISTIKDSLKTLIGYYSYGYDDGGVRIKDCYYDLKSVADSVVITKRNETIIDDNYNKENIFMPYNIAFSSWQSNFKADSLIKLSVSYVIDPTDPSYINSSIYKYFYSDYDGPQTSISEIPQEMNAKLFPNPASDFITIDFKAENGLLHLYNLNGKLVFVDNITQNQKMNLSHILPGVYIYKLILEDGEKAGKIVIE